MATKPGPPITPAGMAALKARYDHLLGTERPEIVEIVSWAAGNGDRSENGDYIYGKKRLREIDRRLRYLMKRIDSAEVVDPARQRNLERVFFGATVTFVDADGDPDAEESTLRIVSEATGLFCVGMLVGWLVVANAPGWGGPVIAATIMLALAGRLIFDGTFLSLGLGMTITTVVTVGFYLRDLVDIGT